MVLHEKLCRLGPSWETSHTARLKTHETFIKRANEIKSVYELDVLENRKEQITVMPLSNTLIDIEYEIKIEFLEHNKNIYPEHELKAHTLRYIHSRYPTGAWIVILMGLQPQEKFQQVQGYTAISLKINISRKICQQF
jgi:hypothetical protein